MKILKNFVLAFFILALAGCASNEKIDGHKYNHLYSKHHIVKKTKRCQKVNINKATAKQLMTINGINKTRAENLVKYREKHGDFKSLTDLKNVTGFDKKAIKKIKHCLTF